MITGYNTDIEYDGVIYHVQTEDKGIDTPVILSLVYLKGAILASKRTPYDDLIAAGFDSAILSKRLQRQHKLICAAVHAGRIEELKLAAEREADVKRPKRKKRAEPTQEQAQPGISQPEAAAVASRADGSSGTAASQGRFKISGVPEAEPLRVSLLEEPILRSGESVTLRVLVTRAMGDDREPVAKARVTLKILGTSFRPESTISTSDQNGTAMIFAQLPRFTTGRAAVLIRAEAGGDLVELRRIILPS